MNLLTEDEVRTININRITHYSDTFVYGVVCVYLFAKRGMKDEAISKVKEAYAPFQRLYAFDHVYPSSDLVYESIIGFNKDEFDDTKNIVASFAASLGTLCNIDFSEDVDNATKFLIEVTKSVSDKMSEYGTMELGYFIMIINDIFHEILPEVSLSF